MFVYVAVREYDCEGYRIIGIFDSREGAEEALKRNNDECYGVQDVNAVHRLEMNTYFDINEITL